MDREREEGRIERREERGRRGAHGREEEKEGSLTTRPISAEHTQIGFKAVDFPILSETLSSPIQPAPSQAC
jgi:hypothetical protein